LPSTTQKKPKLFDERLVTAFSHETRAHAMGVFAVRSASTKEVADELGQSVSAVWYHVDLLLRLGCIEQVETRKRRGANERFFRATVPHYFEDEVWESIPKKKRMAIVTGILRLISADLNEAVRSDRVDTVDNHLSRSLLNLDAAGWLESKEVLDGALEALYAIRERSTMRMAETGEQSTRVAVAIMQFELPRRAAR
jgi:hypothetical protein